MFSSALLFYFLASQFFPLWVLLIGPIIWGVPHIISSLRYTNLSFSKSAQTQLLRFQFCIWSAVFVYRLLIDVFQFKLFWYDRPLMFEVTALLVSFVYQFHIYSRNNLKIDFGFILSTVLFSILTVMTYYYPIQTALLALIGHNYLPLYAWYKSCQTPSDLKVFFTSAFLYIVASLCIYFGVLDSVYATLPPSGNIAFLKWDYSEVISPFVVGEMDYKFWYHIVVLYAFSQAMHYFIWMKAIPENYQLQQYPPSFKWSFNRLVNDFGSGSIFVLLGICFLGLIMWLFLEFQTARLVYFSIASYHGFMEISALPFLKSNRKDLNL
ncbi:MAG: hypothetical protein ABL930_01620 [Pseudobdellovibrio sp.]